jgi:hypothetical protein
MNKLFSSYNDLLNIELDVLRNNLPKDRSGDILFSLIIFIRIHNRLPQNTKTINDFLYRIKTSNEILDPLRVFITDKEFVKLYIKAVIGDEFNVPTIDILRKKEEVTDYPFPSDCCIKPTHASGQYIIRKKNETLNLRKIINWLDFNYYDLTREANYKSLTPKIIIEPVLFNNSNITDYKIFCYNGVPKLIHVDFDRLTCHTRKYFDTKWNGREFDIKYKKVDFEVPKPKKLELMLDIASKLSKPFSLIRVDFYTDDENVCVGELTNCAASASIPFQSYDSEVTASKIIFEE